MKSLAERQAAMHERMQPPPPDPQESFLPVQDAPGSTPEPPVKLRKPRQPAIEPRGLSRKQTARYLGCSMSTVDRLQADGVLRPMRYPGVRKILFDRVALDLVIDQAAASTVPATVPATGSKYGYFEVSRGKKRLASD